MVPVTPQQVPFLVPLQVVPLFPQREVLVKSPAGYRVEPQLANEGVLAQAVVALCSGAAYLKGCVPCMSCDHGHIV